MDDPRLKQFDLLLAPSRRRLRRILEAGNARPERAAVVGYSKFDLVRRLGLERPSPFNNGRPTVVYNPHHRPGTSSWHAMGRAVLDHFAARDDFNLIFAPHVKLFDPPAEHLDAFRGYAGLDHVKIDLGSEASIDMTYLLGADIYLGDISSQVFEFLLRPRPCLFLNPHRLAWRDDPDFESGTSARWSRRSGRWLNGLPRRPTGSRSSQGGRRAPSPTPSPSRIRCPRRNAPRGSSPAS